MTKEKLTIYTNRISNANPSQLVVIQYDMAIDYLQDALAAYEQNSLQEFTCELKRAKRVINQLSSVLDMKYQISAYLHRIYLFINNAIIRAIARRETAEIERCIKMLEKLRQSFEEVSRQDSRGPVMENTQQVYAGLTYSKGALNEMMSENSNRGYTV